MGRMLCLWKYISTKAEVQEVAVHMINLMWRRGDELLLSQLFAGSYNPYYHMFLDFKH